MSQERSRSSRKHTQSSRTSEGPLDWLRQHFLLAALLLALVVALLAEMPWLSRTVRTYLLQGDTVALLTLLAASGPYQDDLRTAARRGPNPLLLALLAWCILSAALAPYRTFAIAELLRLFLCAGVYFAAAYGLTVREAPLAAYGVLVLGGGVALYGLIQFGSGQTLNQGEITSIFGNHEQFGSFLALLLPVALAFALDREGEPKVLMGAQAIALIVGGALLLARTRSAWAGGVAGLLVLSFLAMRYAPVKLNRANKALIIGPLLIVVLGFALFLGVSQIAPLLSTRAATLTHVLEDTSFADRLHRWKSACRMASEKPVTGWGLGAFPVIQFRWTHEGDGPGQVLAHGTGHSNLAHNFWVQWGAETGGVGLGLYVAVIVAFFGIGLVALRTMSSGTHRTLLMGCLAATAGGVADAMGAPSYTFPGVSSLFWLWIGLGVAACRARDDSTPTLPPTSPGVWVSSLGMGAAAAMIVLGVGFVQRP